jgi:hypothetical protein
MNHVKTAAISIAVAMVAIAIVFRSPTLKGIVTGSTSTAAFNG